MKKTLALVVSVFLMLSLAACGGAQDPAGETTDTPNDSMVTGAVETPPATPSAAEPEPQETGGEPPAAPVVGETMVNSSDFGDITIPNVVKVGYAAYIGSYWVGYDEATGEDIYEPYDPTGWQGYIFNDSVGMPVYYVAGDSVTVTAAGDIFENGDWLKLSHEEDGTFSFDAEMAHPIYPQGDPLPVSGTGFAKYVINWEALERLWNGETDIEGVVHSDGGSATLTEGVWQAPGIADFVPCLIVVGDTTT